MKLLLALALLPAAAAVCPNACSGHGTCGEDDVCFCYQDWGMGDEESGDCSQKYCPYEFAFVDTPNEDGGVHKYMECSGKGICDRSVGECECFEGYAGKGCQRTTCPNDCSGHGTCEYIDELSFGSTPGEYAAAKPSNFSMGLSTKTRSAVVAQTFLSISESWDSMKSMACVCDAGYIDVDCSRRMCPKGNDIFDTRLDTSDGVRYQVQNITLVAAGPFGNGSMATYGEFSNRSFALTFISTLNESYTTIPITIGDNVYTSDNEVVADFESVIKNALENLPNGVIDTVNVGVNFGSEWSDYDAYSAQWQLNIKVTFTGDVVAGPQNFLIPQVDECLSGCTPKITGLNLVSVQDATGTYSRVEELSRADYNNYECGRRGKCDYDSGICECFEGYTGLACGTQTALV